MSFWQFLIRRILYVVPTIFLVTVIVFSILQLIPGDPVDALLAEDQDPEMREILLKQLGLDKPIPVQYAKWMGRIILHGDLGQSILHTKPVVVMIGEHLPRTAYLALASILVALFISFPLGISAAVKHKTGVDYAAQTTALLGLSVPSFWAALLLMLFFGVKLGWFPTFGYVPPNEDFLGFLHHLALPAFVLGFEMTAVLTRMTRSTMLEELNKDYVQTHRAQGLREAKVVAIYTLKNALLPTATIAGMRFAALLGGTVVIESIFSWPGIGLMILDGILLKDYPVVQGGVLVLGCSFIFINLFIDIFYKWLDPRIQLV